MRLRRNSFGVFVLLLGATALDGERLPTRLYTTDDGLASNHINRIVQDSRGFLWFCTREGLSLFDGYQFTNFGREQGLPGRDRDLLQTRSGEYWVATGDGIARLSPSASKPAFTLYRPANPKAREINALADDGSGGIWCGTSAGLYHLEQKDGGWGLRFVDIGMPTTRYGDDLIESLLRDRAGNLWIGGHRGLYCRSPNGHHEHCILRNNPWHDHIFALLQDRQGRLWIGTAYGLLRTYVKPGRPEPLVEKEYTKGKGLTDNRVNSVFETSDRQLWIGTAAGLDRHVSDIQGDEFEKFSSANGLADNGVDALSQDRDGNLWIATIGVQKVSRAGFATYGRDDGLALNHVVSIFENRSGQLCAITRDSRVNCFDGRRFHSILPNFPSRMLLGFWGLNQITFQDHSGHWWVPTGQGVLRFPATNFSELGSAHPDAVYNARSRVPGAVFRLFEDSRGDVWISTWFSSALTAGGVLMRLERATGTIHRYSAADGVPPTMAAAFAEDSAANLWIGFSDALVRYSSGRFRVFDAPKDMGRYDVQALYADSEGRLWAACVNGLVRIDSPATAEPRFTVYTKSEGLASSDVQCVTEDKWGRMYVGTGRGVDCFYPQRLPHIRHYTKADGLALGDEMEAFRDRHGTLWFASNMGLSRLDPEPERPRSPPPVFITALRVRGVPRPISPLGEMELPRMRLGPDQNQIEVQFVGLGFATGEVLRYQYRLEGTGADWSQATDQRRIDFASLAPGNYRFLVRAVTTDGLVNAKPAAVAFTIAPPLYERLWLRATLLALIAAAIYFLHRHRVSRLLEVERLRTRIATDLHDDVGSTLSQIAILSEVASRGIRKEEQLEPLSEIAHLSRESVDSMSDIVWAIDPGQDRLEDLSHRMRRFANDLFTSDGTLLQFRAPRQGEELELNAEMRRQIFLIFKESLHNAARHSRCTGVEIDLCLQKGSLELTIQDNGSGFDISTVQKGHGLSSIEQRAKELGGRITINSAPSHGTIVHLRVPIGHHFARSHKRTYTNG